MRVNFEDALKAGAGLNGGGSRLKAHRVLVITEVALAFTLLVGSALLMRSFVVLRQVHPGFDAHDVLTMETPLIGERFATAERVASAARQGIDRLSGLAQVEVAAATLTGVPLSGTSSALNVSIVGRPRADEFSYPIFFNVVSPKYLNALRVPIVRGRGFSDQDVAGATPVVLINLAMARRYWPATDPLRDSLVVGPRVGGEFEETVPRQIIGIVGDVHQSQLRYAPRAGIYVPLAQVSGRQTALLNRLGLPITWIAQTRGDPHALTGAIQREIRAATGGIPVSRVRSMDDVSSASTAANEAEMSLVTIFGGVALVLAAVGLFGVLSYSVEQRRREIGIRMALGAQGRQVRRMVLLDAVAVTSIGVVVGVSVSFGLTRFMGALLFGISRYDTPSFVAVAFTLAAVAVSAAWLPARRASAVNPMSALRAE